MMRILPVPLVMAFLVGCSAAAGFRDEAIRQLGSIVADELAPKLDDNHKELRTALTELPSRIPMPPKQEDNTLLYSLGALAAYILGSAGKGFLRGYLNKRSISTT